MEHNFKKHIGSDAYGTHYDYASIMHYGERAFSKNGQPTMIAKKPGVTFGRQTKLSATDAVEMRRRYNCPGGSIRCNFDNGLCKGWSQSLSDQFDWMVRGGKTPTHGTGPSADHSGSGKYVYIETSKRRPKDKAVLLFKGYSGGTACLSFYYHMYGRDINRLIVYLGGSKIFAKKKDKGDKWKRAKVTINRRGTISFIGIRGKGFKGDIAIDDFSITRGSCGGGGPPTPPPPPTPPNPGKCGSRPNVRIVGGTNAEPNSWPWQAMLRTTSGFPFCGGSLIAPQWVLSAAHCIEGKSPSSLFIRMGAHRRFYKIGTEQDFRVSNVIPHWSYQKPIGLSYDFALIKLEKPALLNKDVGLVCVPDGSTPAMPIDNFRKKCWITGWGTLASGGASPDILQQAAVPLVSKNRCLRGYPYQIHDSMLCAGLDQGGVDACQGDSGGPLVCEYNGKWFIEGATSWGAGCAAPGKYGVYAKVRYVKNWIDQTIKRYS
ncbi:hypothetical protein ACROYT_G018650 [Oculina patagonica]